MTWASDLAFDQAGEPVDPVAADADAVPGRLAVLVLGEVDADRQVERMQSLLLQVVAQLLDPRLVLHRPEAVRGAGRSLGRVLAVLAVHQVEVLGLRCSTAPGRRSEIGQAGERPPWWRSSPKSSGRSRNRAAP